MGLILYYNSDPEAMSSLPPISHFHNKFTVCVHLGFHKCMLFRPISCYLLINLSHIFRGFDKLSALFHVKVNIIKFIVHAYKLFFLFMDIPGN